MSILFYQILNFSILVIGLGWIIYRALSAQFKKQRASLEKRMSDASAAYHKVKAELDSARQSLGSLDAKLSEMKAHSDTALKSETQKIRIENDAAIAKLVADTELRLHEETERSKRSLEKTLLHDAIVQARELLKKELKADDAQYTSEMLHPVFEESRAEKAANYGS